MSQRRCPRPGLALGLALVLPSALAQVTPAEPFGGRPFGADPQASPQVAPPPLPMGAGPPSMPPVPVAVPVPVPVPAPAPVPVPVPAPAPAPVPAQLPAMTAPGAVSARNSPLGAMPPPAAVSPGSLGAASAPAAVPARGLPAGAPALVLGGSVWSADPRLRRLLVNGLPLPEGADAAEGVRIEAIGRDQAVLGFRGQRYTVSF